MAGKYLTSFDGAKIYYEKSVKDESRWLVFLHGFGGDLGAWEKEVAFFKNLNYSTLALDLRGHGLSSKSDDLSFYNLENFAKDLNLILEAEKIKKPILIGHCFGGMVTIYFQTLFPDKSKALILVDTSYKPPFIGTNLVAQAFLKQFFKLFSKIFPNIAVYGHADFNQFLDTSDIDFKRLLSDMLHTSLKSYFTLCESLSQFNAKKLLDKISVPTLVIEGTDDTIFPPDIAKYLHHRIKTSQLDLIEGANHILVINNPKELEESMQNFLQKIKY